MNFSLELTKFESLYLTCNGIEVVFVAVCSLDQYVLSAPSHAHAFRFALGELQSQENNVCVGSLDSSNRRLPPIDASSVQTPIRFAQTFSHLSLIASSSQEAALASDLFSLSRMPPQIRFPNRGDFDRVFGFLVVSHAADRSCLAIYRVQFPTLSHAIICRNDSILQSRFPVQNRVVWDQERPDFSRNASSDSSEFGDESRDSSLFRAHFLSRKPRDLLHPFELGASLRGVRKQNVQRGSFVLGDGYGGSFSRGISPRNRGLRTTSQRFAPQIGIVLLDGSFFWFGRYAADANPTDERSGRRRGLSGELAEWIVTPGWIERNRGSDADGDLGISVCTSILVIVVIVRWVDP